jgi:hypothetical protein
MATIDNKISPIEDFIKQGLAQRFKQTFGCVLTYTTSLNKKAARAKLMQSKAGYPMAFASLKTWSIDETRYSPKTLYLRGVSSQSSTDSKLTYKIKPLPVTMTYEVTFYSQDMNEMTTLGKKWLFAIMEGGLKFNILYGVADIGIALDLDRELQFTEKTNELTETDQFEMIATMRIHGYLSPDHMETVQAITEIVEEGFVGDQALLQALEPGARGEHQLIMFKRWNDVAGPQGSVDDPRSVGP